MNNPISIDEAIKLLPEVSKSKFVGSVDVDVLLNLKEKQKKEVIRGSVSLPNSFGEDKKVIVFCEENLVKEALEAGATKAGMEELVKELEAGFNDFDIVVATPSAMPKLVKLGKILGPKGLMPNPKNGTISQEVGKAVSSFKSGRLNFKSIQDHGVIKMRIAKLDMTPEQIKENLLAFFKAVQVEVKKYAANPYKQVIIKPTMGTSLKIDVNDIIKNL
jgi:large subunit ribosomal protein L1